MSVARLGLTRTHGFFMIMGGFHYFTGSPHEEHSCEPKNPVRWQDVIVLLENQRITLPTKGEIQDKGKSDWIAKTIVLLQTLWFATQCIARGIEHLPITELEIVTLAYTIINFGTLFAWWYKPRNVECPIRVFEQPVMQNDLDSEPLWSRVLVIIVGAQDELANLHKAKKVPIFYSGNPGHYQLIITDCVTSIIGVVFGAIYCIAWSFEFATPIQVLLWRLSAVSITAVPILPMISFGLGVLANKWPVAEWPLVVFMLTTPLQVLLYITARVSTIVLAFMNLSSLPPGAFETVQWTTFIPHL
jgi:hypothetical protein